MIYYLDQGYYQERNGIDCEKWRVSLLWLAESPPKELEVRDKAAWLKVLVHTYLDSKQHQESNENTLECPDSSIATFFERQHWITFNKMLLRENFSFFVMQLALILWPIHYHTIISDRNNLQILYSRRNLVKLLIDQLLMSSQWLVYCIFSIFNFCFYVVQYG